MPVICQFYCNLSIKLQKILTSNIIYFRGKSIHPFCSKVKRDPLQTECTSDRNSVALCNLVKHEFALPKEYQNFDSLEHIEKGEEEFYGGSVSLADHCPYIQEFTWRSKNVVVRGSQCQYEENNPSEFIRLNLTTYFNLIYLQNLKRTLLQKTMETSPNASTILRTCGRNDHVGKHGKLQ